MDDLFFADGVVHSVGQIIGAIAADTKAHAQAAAKAVVIEYEDMPYILTIDEAIAAQSFFKPRPVLHRGDPDNLAEYSDYVIEGEFKMGGQEHFYLGTQGSVVIPHPEDDEIEVWSATQNPTETQVFVSSALGIPQNRCTVRVKRLGGAFGGAETRSIGIAVPAAILAKRLKRPVRIHLDRDEDMVITGGLTTTSQLCGSTY
jgi:xanthine dehydrogenase/oxidase